MLQKCHVSLGLCMNEIIEILLPFASDKSDQVLRDTRRIIRLLEFVHRLLFEKEQIVSQTDPFPSLGYLKLTERAILSHFQSRRWAKVKQN